MNTRDLILASESPYRKELLNKLGLSFRALAPQLDESALQQTYQGSPADLSLYLAEQKAVSLASDFPNANIIGSDQVLLFQGQPLHKPKNREQVKDRLTRLNGHTHQLSTAICLRLWDGRILKKQVLTQLTMHQMSEMEIESYIDQDLAIGCAGGYKIESNGIRLFSQVETEDYNSVIGLPLLTLNTWLRQEGFFKTKDQ